MKNIHIIPTDKPTGIFKSGDNLLYSIMNKVRTTNEGFHIYITSDEEIKEGDWYISILENEVYKATKETQNIMSVANLIGTTSYKKTHFKITLTTDQDLIKDGVHAIDDEFLEWFVKNPSCEYVEIENIYDKFLNGDKRSVSDFRNKYKIIIPKEEPKQHVELINDNIEEFDKAIKLFKQETLEEAAENYAELSYYGDEVDAFVRGAKWQQEQDKKMYSEEEVVNILIKAYIDIQKRKISNQAVLASWFEQFKKK